MIKTITSLATFAIALSVAHAENHAPSKKNYISIGAIAEAQVDSSNRSIDSNNGYILAYGHRIDHNLSVELSYSQLLNISSSNGSNEIDLLSLSGLYHFSVGKSSPYVKLGYVDSNIETELLETDANGGDDGFVWGVGLDWQVNQQTIRLGYSFSDLSDVEYDEYSISALINF